MDLVGHDWGRILTARIASLRPDLVCTWAGGNGPISAQYAWHPLAKIWQDPVEGDQMEFGEKPGRSVRASGSTATTGRCSGSRPRSPRLLRRTGRVGPEPDRPRNGAVTDRSTAGLLPIDFIPHPNPNPPDEDKPDDQR
ncbi:hypothetical protein ACQEV4_27375 [Streptomyces shenzhenensis]|uniref:hypothetical protein n=1 Tax=Streptomyces shenzhenensis TaxID=943815 RepID=UPI003D92DF77